MSVEGTMEKQVSPIFKALNRLDASISTLSDVTAHIQGQLSPVFSDKDTAERESSPEPYRD